MSNFDDYINETTNEILVLGVKLKPSEVLKETDPIAYRCLKADFDCDD